MTAVPPDPAGLPASGGYPPPVQYTPLPFDPAQARADLVTPAPGSVRITPRRQRRRWPALVALLALAAGGVVAYRVLSGDSTTDGYPSAWDPRVLPAVQFVEQDRGLEFKHPVEVDFLSDSEFRKQVTEDPSKLTAAERTRLADVTAELRAVGLVSGHLDLAHAVNQLQGADVVGEYSFRTKTIAVRGQTLSVSATVTLVHELTHALQDQYYDISSYGKSLKDSDSGAQDGFQAVVEGDATRVEQDYVHSLSSAQRRLESRQEHTATKHARGEMKGIPQFLVAEETLPYALGRAMVEFESAVGGPDSVNGLFTKWPTSDMQIMQPWRYVAAADPRPVARPALRPGETRFDAGTFGASTWYFMLAEKLGPARALSAVDGWAGDNFVAYHTAGSTCVRINYAATSSAELSTMLAALTAWVHSSTIDASVTQSGRLLRFESCDPGAADSRPIAGRSSVAVRFAMDRVDLATVFVHSGVPMTAAACAATKVVDEVPLAQIASDRPSAHTKQAVMAAVAACR